MTRRQVLSAFAGATTARAAVGRYLPPVDESVSDPTFLQFHASLVKICQTRDVSRLMPILGPDIRLDFGERNIGPRAFAKGWRLDRPGSSSLWRELETVLQLGCTKGNDENSFSAPYVFSRFPHDLDDAAHDVVIQKDLPLFAEMNEKSGSLELLHWDILERLSAFRAG